MFAVKVCLVLIGLQTAYGRRAIRSPDKMEIDIPHREQDGGEYQEDMNKEAEYWHGQGGQLEDKEEAGHDQMHHDREKNEEAYHHEKEHHYNNQQNYNKQMNNTYQSDKDKLESHHDDNQNHYQEHDTDFVTSVPEMNSETGDRYEDKGEKYREEGEDKMQNYEPGQDYPTITYTRD